MILASGARGPGFNSQSSPLYTTLPLLVTIDIVLILIWERRGAYERSAILNLKFSSEASGPRAKYALAGVEDSSISGLVVEYIVAIDVTRVRFPADALFCYN